MFQTLHKFRAASNGKPFTRTERINIVNRKNTLRLIKAARVEEILKEKNRIAQEREKRETAAKVRAALLANPDVKKIKQKKSGEFYFQPRIGGKLGPAVVVA